MIAFVSRAPQAEQEHWMSTLACAMPEETIVSFDDLSDAQKNTCELAIVANPDPLALQALPQLKWVHSVWAGVERMVMELGKPSFSIVRLVDPELAKTMSEAVLAWSLFLHREMFAYQQQQANSEWLPRPMVRAKDRRIGILGLGELGKASAMRLKENGFDVRGWSRNPKELQGISCFDGEKGLYELLQQSDILVCLLPLTKQTTGLLNQATLACLPERATIINFARGAIIDDVSLLTALDQQVAHAVLDVFSQEPLPKDHPYWQHPRVSVLPHISAPTHPESASQIVAANIRGYREKGEIPPAVDIEIGY
ncbi:2-hydroxyacid dehydrogenase [Marinomonas pollencensis]|uniref:Glyoxylate/hydroxypyruvate reductase A n=1 Tax=Marinomonas pollencensis TaxID=491954 RepID=A0A3E0DTE2_9GAMM|nr:glyoxylate/hydroxypyruvate reductase A [Marinomonas pollencensis]REG86803.1 glyoxylate/hydroxypyruvate reductase A [Marinomonas pollencensis]